MCLLELQEHHLLEDCFFESYLLIHLIYFAFPQLDAKVNFNPINIFFLNSQVFDEHFLFFGHCFSE